MHCINSAALCLTSPTIALFIFMCLFMKYNFTELKTQRITNSPALHSELLYINYANTLYMCYVFNNFFLTI